MKLRRFIVAVLMVILMITCLPAVSIYADENDFNVDAKAAILIDSDSGKVLYEKNADEQCYPASTTKIMTALLAFEAIDRGELSMDQVITVKQEALDSITDPEASTIYLAAGEEVPVKDLLYSIMLPSANDAANVMAVVVSGDVDTFVEKMNSRAKELGCTGTHFANPNGLHDDDHYTTARDMALIAMECMKHEQFRKMASTGEYAMPATNYSQPRDLYTTDYMIRPGSGFYYEYANGIKTGYTSSAGHCLISSATRYFNEEGAAVATDDVSEDEDYTVRNYIAVVMFADDGADGQNTAFDKNMAMLEHAFNDFMDQKMLEKNYVLRQVPVTLSEDGEYCHLKTSNDVIGFAEKNADMKEVTWEVEAPEELEAPVVKGEKYGVATVYYKGEEIGTVDLVASEDLSFSQSLYMKQQISNFFASVYGKVAIGLVVALILAIIVLINLKTRKPGGR